MSNKNDYTRENVLINKYNQIVNLYINYTNQYWKVYSIFLVLMGLLLAGFTQIFQSGLGYVFIYCIGGIIIAFIWMPVVRRNLVYAEIAEDLGRNLEKDMVINKKMRERIPEKNGLSNIRRANWEREKTLVGLGYFQSTQQILYFELKENKKESWINKRYKEYPYQKWLVKFGGGGSPTGVWIPVLFVILWIGLLIVVLIQYQEEIISFIDP